MRAVLKANDHQVGRGGGPWASDGHDVRDIAVDRQ